MNLDQRLTIFLHTMLMVEWANLAQRAACVREWNVTGPAEFEQAHQRHEQAKDIQRTVCTTFEQRSTEMLLYATEGSIGKVG
jgi:hypothetical protein